MRQRASDFVRILWMPRGLLTQTVYELLVSLDFEADKQPAAWLGFISVHVLSNESRKAAFCCTVSAQLPYSLFIKQHFFYEH
jgi:hypothetical protein